MNLRQKIWQACTCCTSQYDSIGCEKCPYELIDRCQDALLKDVMCYIHPLRGGTLNPGTEIFMICEVDGVKVIEKVNVVDVGDQYVYFTRDPSVQMPGESLPWEDYGKRWFCALWEAEETIKKEVSK